MYIYIYVYAEVDVFMLLRNTLNPEPIKPKRNPEEPCVKQSSYSSEHPVRKTEVQILSPKP